MVLGVSELLRVGVQVVVLDLGHAVGLEHRQLVDVVPAHVGSAARVEGVRTGRVLVVGVVISSLAGAAAVELALRRCRSPGW